MFIKLNIFPSPNKFSDLKIRVSFWTMLFLCLAIVSMTLPPAAWSGTTEPDISAGWDHSIALKSDGTIWTWGWNPRGQLGDNTTADSSFPIQVGIDNTWVSVTAGYGHTVALKSDGTVWAWGSNVVAQLGDGTLIEKHTPIQVGTDNTYVSLASGLTHNITLRSDGTMWAWGANGYGQLGYTTTETCTGGGACSTTPNQVSPDTDWIIIKAGGYHTLAIKSDGTLWIWGRNDFGELGDGTTSHIYYPVQMGIENSWVSVSAGEYHTLAIKADGSLWSWGRNDWGQLGHTSSETCISFITSPCTTTPQQVGTDTDWIFIATVRGHQSYAIKSDGTLWAWGRNAAGQLGDGTTTDRSTPVQVGIDTIWEFIAGGGSHSMAIKTDNTLWTWGSNKYGALGFTTTETCTTQWQSFYCSKLPTQLLDLETCQNLPARIEGITPSYYSSLQQAYNTAAEGNTIQSREAIITENVYLDRVISVVLEGGYDCDYVSQSGATIINGNISVTYGVVNINNLIMQ